MRMLATVVLLGCSVVAPARADNWTGAVSSDWFDPANWSGGDVPSPGEMAVLDHVTPNPAMIRGRDVHAFAGQLLVGQFDRGRLIVTNGATLSSASSRIGDVFFSSGEVEVSEGGSKWTVDGDFAVGYEGIGNLDIRNGGVVSTSLTAGLGMVGDGRGRVRIDGPGSKWTHAGVLTVGGAGTGTLSVVDRGSLVGGDGGSGGGVIIGGTSSGSGVVLVGVAGTHWSETFVTVGQSGLGTVSIYDGATAQASLVTVGANPGSRGDVSISGAGSSWIETVQTVIGLNGEGYLRIENGGRFETRGDAIVGDSAGSEGTAVVTGSGSLWGAPGGIVIGESSEGTLSVLDRGAVAASTTVFGNTAAGQGRGVISGFGSTWTNVAEVRVGNGGLGNLRIEAGGRLASNGNVFLAALAGSQGVVDVSGNGSRLEGLDAVVVGLEGDGALTVGSDGAVSAGTGIFLGRLAGSSGTLNIGGAAGSPAAAPGRIETSGIVFGDGTGTINFKHTASSYLFAPVISGVGTVNVLLGPTIFTGENTYTGNTNVIGTLQIGNGGASGSIVSDITNAGAVVFDRTGQLTYAGVITGSGRLRKRGGGTLTLTGDSSQGETIADAGLLHLQDGGSLATGILIVADSAADVAGVSVMDGGNLDVGTVLTVGNRGSGTLSTFDGGTVDTGNAVIGDQAGSQGTVTVDGAGSAWNIGGNVFVGQAGTGTLDITDAGEVVTDNQGVIGYSAGSTGTVNVTGPGSAWTLHNALQVGREGTGDLVIADGGVASLDPSIPGAAHLLVGSRQGATGTMTVTGTDSAWNGRDGVFVADHGTGTLAIENGGVVSDGMGILGNSAGGVGMVVVRGTGSQWNSRDFLWVGRAGSGELTVSDGGAVSATAGVEIAQDAGATGTLNIGAGEGEAAVAAGVVDTPSILFGAGNGTLNFNHTGSDYSFGAAIGGSGTINQLAGTTILTGAGDAGGALNVRGGMLRVEGTLGDIATTVFDGATLGGSGAIGGDVSVADGGILAPGSSAGTLALGSLALSAGSILDYELGQAGVIGGGVNDLIEIGGDLTLDGTLDITDIGGFGAGVYRLMNYGGALTDNGLEFGTLPTAADPHDLFLQTAIDGQVNLVNSAGLTLSFWDGSVATEHNNGAIDDGDGAWNADNDNWTASDGALNGRWDDGTFAVFGGTASNVEVVGEQAVVGMQFMSGYTLDTGANGALRIDGAESVIRVDPTVTATIAAPIVGAGGLVKTDTGTLVLSGTNTYAGGTRIDRGTLQVASNAHLGATAGALSFDGGTLRNTGAFDLSRAVALQAGGGTFDTAANLGIDSVIAGAGTLGKTGAGTLTLTGANSYTGGTRVQAGTLIGDVDAIRGDIANAGTVVFDQGADATFGGAISGSGDMVKRGAGALTLGGGSALDWSIDAGELVARAAQFSGDAAIADGATLRFSETTGGYAGTLSGAGTFAIAGGSTPFALTGNSAGFSGSTFLQTGTLHIDGSLGGLTALTAGTMLSGTGTLGSVDNAGTVAAGNSIGTLTLTGDYTHRADATLLAEIEPGGDSDLLDVAGSATLEGGTVDVIKAPGQYRDGTRYTLIDAAGGVTGTFTTLDQDLPFLDLLLAYDANHAYLDVVRNAVDFDIVCGGGTFNHCQVAGALDEAGDADTITPDLRGVLGEVTTLGLEQARASFDRLSGEAHASFAGAMLEGHALYGQTVTRRIAERREAAGAQQLQGGAWARAYGRGSELDGDGNAHGAEVDLHGAAFGVDAWGTESWLIGASFNAMRVDADFRAGDGGEADAKNVSLYTSVQGERAYLDGVVSFAWWDSEIQRRIEVGTIHRQASSDYDSNRLALYLEGGWNIELGGSRLQPLVSVQRDRLDTQNLSESGAQGLDLVGRSQNTTRTTASAGVRWSGDHARGEWTLAPTAQLRWLHSTGDLAPEFELAFAGAPESSYRVRGVGWPEDRGLVGAGLQASRGTLDLFVDYDYQRGGGLVAHNLSAGLRYRW